jgi:hypothetical protein
MELRMHCKDCEYWTTKRCSKASQVNKEGKWGTIADHVSCNSFALDFELAEDLRLENKAW